MQQEDVRIQEWDIRASHISELHVTSMKREKRARGEDLDLLISGFFLCSNTSKIEDNVEPEWAVVPVGPPRSPWYLEVSITGVQGVRGLLVLTESGTSNSTSVHTESTSVNGKHQWRILTGDGSSPKPTVHYTKPCQTQWFITDHSDHSHRKSKKARNASFAKGYCCCIHILSTEFLTEIHAIKHCSEPQRSWGSQRMDHLHRRRWLCVLCVVYVFVLTRCSPLKIGRRASSYTSCALLLRCCVCKGSCDSHCRKKNVMRA
jgi:hypothetical protein